MTKEDMVLAREIAYNLSIPIEFGPEEELGDIEDDLVIDVIAGVDVPVEVFHGITKMVVVPNKGNFVVKIPFNGYHCEEESYIEDEDRYEYVNCFRPYLNANDEDGWDYCRDELNKYRAAVKAGFGDIIAEVGFVGYYSDCPIYWQEKVIPYEVGHSRFHPSADSLSKSHNVKFRYKSCTEDWRAMVIETYGIDYWESFVDWVDETGLEILEDMHTGNFGYRMDGRPVLFDISGWRDDF